MTSLPDSGWVRALLDLKPAGALVVAIGFGALVWLGLVPELVRWILLVAMVVCLAPPVNWLVGRLEGWRSARRESKRRPAVLANLNDLGPKEQAMLAGCLRRNEPSFNCFLGDPTAFSLRQKGLAALPDWDGDIRRHPHIIPDYVWEELRRRSPDVLAADDARKRAETERAEAERAARNRDSWLRRI